VAVGVVRAMTAEINRQPKVLEKFARSKLARAPSGSVFVGAGDSYAAALAGFYASKGDCIALDPYSLAAAPETADGLDVFFISASGRTASNVMAAKKVRSIARGITVLTADDRSQLAGLADSVVRLPMTYVPKTSGMLSFSLSLLGVLKIASGDGTCDFRRAFSGAERDRLEIASGRGMTYFLGNSLAYPAALYTAAKTYELLGAGAHAELLEEFSHLELFSLSKLDVVNAFSCFDPLDMSGRLASALAKQGYQFCVVPSRGPSEMERLFHSVFVGQLSILDHARKAGFSRPKFLVDRGKLAMSDEMIY